MHTVLVHAFVPLLLHSPGHTRTARKSPDCALFRGLLLLLLLHRPAGGMAGGEGAFPLGLSWRRRGGVVEAVVEAEAEVEAILSQCVGM